MDKVNFIKSYNFPNGEFVSQHIPCISPFDHGLLYGDGIFEGIRIYNGGIFRLPLHIERLYESAAGIELDIGLSKDYIEEKLLETSRRNGLTDGYIRLVVTRGIGDLGLDPKKCEIPTFFIIADTIQLYPQKYYENGIDVITAKRPRPPISVLNPGVKMTQYMNNIFCKLEANKAGVVDALMLTYGDNYGNKFVTECTGANLFFVKKGELYTPASDIVLPGITRRTVMEIATEKEIAVVEGYYKIEDVRSADEVFVTGSGAKICPVRKIDDVVLGTDRPMTREIMEQFDKIIKDPKYLTPIFNNI
ncbi:MAG: aminotransferase class IV [Candidatus Aenigmatarchaeota archaeon]